MRVTAPCLTGDRLQLLRPRTGEARSVPELEGEHDPIGREEPPIPQSTAPCPKIRGRSSSAGSCPRTDHRTGRRGASHPAGNVIVEVADRDRFACVSRSRRRSWNDGRGGSHRGDPQDRDDDERDRRDSGHRDETELSPMGPSDEGRRWRQWRMTRRPLDGGTSRGRRCRSSFFIPDLFAKGGHAPDHELVQCAGRAPEDLRALLFGQVFVVSEGRSLRVDVRATCAARATGRLVRRGPSGSLAAAGSEPWRAT